MSYEKNYPFLSDSLYDFDSAKIEIVGGAAKLRLQENEVSQDYNDMEVFDF